jgi:hypothetical protein
MSGCQHCVRRKKGYVEVVFGLDGHLIWIVGLIEYLSMRLGGRLMSRRGGERCFQGESEGRHVVR